MESEKEIDMPSFISAIRNAQTEAWKRQIEANTIVIDNRFRYVKPFVLLSSWSNIYFPPMIMGMEIKFADLPNNAAFLICKLDETENERKVKEIKAQAVKEFAEILKGRINNLIGTPCVGMTERQKWVSEGQKDALCDCLSMVDEIFEEGKV
ncbi:MAG: hypothetical protein OSJ39_00660 [Clostridia bacterium]|nr:hypothetical protein [Clostridia bacterium]